MVLLFSTILIDADSISPEVKRLVGGAQSCQEPERIFSDDESAPVHSNQEGRSIRSPDIRQGVILTNNIVEERWLKRTLDGIVAATRL